MAVEYVTITGPDVEKIPFYVMGEDDEYVLAPEFTDALNRKYSYRPEFLEEFTFYDFKSNENCVTFATNEIEELANFIRMLARYSPGTKFHLYRYSDSGASKECDLFFAENRMTYYNYEEKSVYDN